MEYKSVGRFNTEKAKKMIKLLRGQVSHIHWELGWGEGYILDVMKYANICVPEFQHDEAEYIISLLENGADLSDYHTDRRFPILFEKDNGVFKVIKPLTLFAENVQELIQMLESKANDDMCDYLVQISQLLLNLYSLQTHLPECAGGNYYQPWLGFSLAHKFGRFALYYEVTDPFDDKLDARSLDKTMEEILQILQTGLVHYEMYLETDNPVYLTMAVGVWKNQYQGKLGWGAGVINALKVLHYAVISLQQGIRSDTSRGR